MHLFLTQTQDVETQNNVNLSTRMNWWHTHYTCKMNVLVMYFCFVQLFSSLCRRKKVYFFLFQSNAFSVGTMKLVGIFLQKSFQKPKESQIELTKRTKNAL